MSSKIPQQHRLVKCWSQMQVRPAQIQVMLSLATEYSLNVAFEISLVGRPGPVEGMPSTGPLSPVAANDAVSCSGTGSGAGGPDWRTSDDPRPSSAGPVRDCDRAADGARPEDGAQIHRAWARAAGLRTATGRPTCQALAFVDYVR